MHLPLFLRSGSHRKLPVLTPSFPTRRYADLIKTRTPALDETLIFYEEVFDLVRGPASTMADQTRNAWLYDRDGRAIIHVNMPAKDEDIPAIGARGRMDHVAFDCRDPDAMEARLTDQIGRAHV